MANGSPRLRERLSSVRRRHAMTDPNAAKALEEKRKLVPVAPTTEGPNRLAIIVPSDSAEMNLGQAFAGHPQLDDPGICFRTDTHIDFRTTKEPNRTTVTIAGPATRAVKTWDGENLPKATVGYGLGTEQVAYRHARHRVYMLSNNGDIIARAASDKTAVLQSKAGDVFVNAGHDVAIAGGDRVIIGAADYEVRSPAWNAPWAKDASAENESKATNLNYSLAAVLAGALATGVNTTLPIKLGKELTPGTTVAPPVAPLFQLASLATSALANLCWRGGKTVRVFSDEIATIHAHASANLWGNVSATAAAGLVSVAMGTIADLLGVVHAGVFGGVEAGIWSLRKTFVNSNLADIDTYGKNEVIISSNKNTSIQGTEGAHLTSEKDSAVMFGNTGAFVLCDGHGLRATPDDVAICRIDDRSKLFTNAEQDTYIMVGDVGDSFDAVREGTQMLRLNDSCSRLAFDTGNYVNITTSKVEWKGKIHTLGK
jgi:hypothetical protein